MPAVADAGRVAVGLQRGADAERVAAAIERRDRVPPGAAPPDSGSRRRSPGERLARRDRGHPLRRAAALAASRLHPVRPARLAPVVPDPEPLLRAVADASGSRAGPGCGDRLRRGRHAPGARREDPRLTELRRRLCRASTRSATGPSSRVSLRRASETASASPVSRRRPSCWWRRSSRRRGRSRSRPRRRRSAGRSRAAHG